MKTERLQVLSQTFHDSLLDDTLQFWVEHGIDRQYGGFLTFLGRKGELLSPEKGMWVHGRMTWLFARLYNELEQRPEWLDLARHGIDFIKRHGFDDTGRMYFTVARDGRRLRMRRYPFTEIFGVMAFAEYGRAAGDRASITKARELMELVEKLISRPEALSPKFYPEHRQTRSHSIAMIRINTYQVLRQSDPEGSYDHAIGRAIEEVFHYFVKPERRVLLETVGANGELLEGPVGRCVNPGHAIETAWFMLEEAKRSGDKLLMQKALPILDWSLEIGWDGQYGGLLSFVDVEGLQPEQVEWNMKYWWPQTEAIYATLLAYSMTHEERYLDWFDRTHDWAMQHFPDRQYGEWFGYLHRDGSVALDLKGNNWKGPFHLPRQQLYAHLLAKEMLEHAARSTSTD